MIVTLSEIQLFANIPNPTLEERAVLQAIHGHSEAAVKNFLGYDPAQDVHTEYFPRYRHVGGTGTGGPYHWEVKDGGNATLVRKASAIKTLQLHHIPVRAITNVWLDWTAKHGSDSNAFQDADLLTEGTDFWMEQEQDDVCMSGCLYHSNSWPIDEGTVKVTYRAGYSHDEFNGQALESAVGGDGNITTKGLDAGGIKHAVILTALKAIHTWQGFRRNADGQFIPGGFVSERLQDYSYRLPNSTAGQAAGMVVHLPAEAREALEGYRHYGVPRL